MIREGQLEVLSPTSVFARASPHPRSSYASVLHEHFHHRPREVPLITSAEFSGAPPGLPSSF